MTDCTKVILVDDEEIVRKAYQNELSKNGYEVSVFENAEKALPFLTPEWEGVLVSDVVMPGMDGLALLNRVREIDPDIPVILMTGKGDIPMAVQAVRDGAFEFLEKPFSTENFLDCLRHAVEKRRLIMEIRRLRSKILEADSLENRILGVSSTVQRLREIVRGVAETNTDVLIQGETGTGKDLIARCLHDSSQRKNKPFVAINCGALPETIIESELFGHEAGAFTGAQKRRIGKFEFAQGGTVYLDEIESMPLHLQVQLLRVLQERFIERVGSNDPVPVDVRIIAATKEDLKKASDEGRFRMDLFYRLNVVQIHLPALRDRAEDIPFLFQNFIVQTAARTGLEVPTPSSRFLAGLAEKSWDGNVRELKNEAERFVLNESLGLGQFNVSVEAAGSSDNGMVKDSPGFLKNKLGSFEKQLIEEELSRNKGNLVRTHEALGIPRQTLCSKMKKYDLQRKQFL